MISQDKFNSKPEFKQTQSIQSMYDPAIHTLSRMLEKRKAILRKRNDDEGKAAVNFDEFKKELMSEHRISLWFANEVVSSLKRAGKINCFGSYINLPIKADEA
ncbi:MULTISPECIES: hypothetical protein [Acinetobacter]|uniref:Uncharacterized protein n=1 Tax=Acinetobacter higginsii TaxID=70347 RepID=N9SSL9_9GAMM|nr:MULTISPECIES: hypothetical protein [Acinetobacter]ENX57626.1 hypothetical protein F902_02023 [Acinetobacter higginsii]